MGGTVPERDEPLARQLGCRIPNLQVFQRRQDGILHDKCNRIIQFLLPPPKPPEERISEFTGIIKTLYLATFEIVKKWTVLIRSWGKIRGELAVMYSNRMPE